MKINLSFLIGPKRCFFFDKFDNELPGRKQNIIILKRGRKILQILEFSETRSYSLFQECILVDLKKLKKNIPVSEYHFDIIFNFLAHKPREIPRGLIEGFLEQNKLIENN